jgi:hypothetical protein
MEYRQRLSRRERERKGPPFMGIFFTILALALAGIVFYRFQTPKPQKTAPIVISKPAPPPNLTALSDSIIQQCCRSFGLTDSVFLESSLTQAQGPTYHRFRQGWPAELPFLAFAQRLNSMATKRDIQCDCRESSKQGWLDCSLQSGRLVGAKVILDSGRNTNLAECEIGVVLNNLGGMKEESIVKLIRSGVVFSYIGGNDYYPSGELLRLFSRGNITSILKLPANGNGLKMLGQAGKMAKTDKKKKNVVEKTSSTGLFAHHPGARAIILDASSGIDPKTIKDVLNEARRAKLSYLCSENYPDSTDRIAFEVGIPVLRLDLKASDKSLAQLKFDLMDQLLNPDSPRQQTLFIDASKVNPDDLVSVKILFERIGIKLRPFIKLAQKVESL